MTKEKVQTIINKYHDLLSDLENDKTVKYLPHKADTAKNLGRPITNTLPHNALCHVLWMLDQMSNIMSKVEDAWDDPSVQGKIYRWLGFIQGVLWCAGLRSIDEMRDDNR